MEDCECVGGLWSPTHLLNRYQYVSDFFIALAYFSIPLELVYFVKKSAVFPYRWVLVQFGAFIVLCGTTHLINMWTFREHSKTVAMVMTVAKVLTAVVSCATALMLVHIIPDLLSVKTRELFLKNKAAELDREMGQVQNEEETSRQVRELSQQIRSTLDRPAVVSTALAELGNALSLEECALWMPSRNGTELQVAGTLRPLTTIVSVPIQNQTVQQIFSSNRAIIISPNSAVAQTASNRNSPKFLTGDVAAVRIPLFHVSGANGGFTDPNSAVFGQNQAGTFALLTLTLPSDSARRWHIHEMEMVEVVADQLAVALSHAAVLESSLLARDFLTRQNEALDAARREAETAIRARNDFLAVMNHEMRTPMHAIIALSTLLQETELTPEQRSMVDTVLKSSNLLATLISDVLDLSRMEDGSLKVESTPFNLKSLIKEAVNLVKPVSAIKRITLKDRVSTDLPEIVEGDSKRFIHVILNVLGNAVKFTKEGSVGLSVTAEKVKEPRVEKGPIPEFKMVPSEKHVYIRVQVKDSGVGIKPEEIGKLFHKYVQADAIMTRNHGGMGLGLPISRRFVSMMEGAIWLESEGVGKGTVVTFIVRFAIPEKAKEAEVHKKDKSGAVVSKVAEIKGTKVLVVDDNNVNRKVTKGLLSRLGCEVMDLSSGRECLSALAGPGHGFKVLLLDLMMPDMDGYEVAKRLTARHSKGDLPLIVALTSNSDRETKEKFLALGGDGVVTKPVNQQKMRTVLQELNEHGKVMTDFTQT